MFYQFSLLGTGLVNTFDPLNFSMILVGLVIGILAGALPGITMLNAIVLVLRACTSLPSPTMISGSTSSPVRPPLSVY